MIVTLMGMSGTGKSYWSEKMEDYGFKRFGCDDMISERLIQKLQLTPEDNFEMHTWVGFPYEDTHKDHAALYFETEIEVMQEILDYLKSADPAENIVVDTSGSAIYTPAEIMESLGRLSKRIYLAVTPEMIDSMLEKYLQKPVAVLWNGLFSQIAGETLEETFKRCYPQLLNSRDGLYRKFSDKIVGPEIHRDPKLTTEAFIQALN